MSRCKCLSNKQLHAVVSEAIHPQNRIAVPPDPTEDRHGRNNPSVDAEFWRFLWEAQQRRANYREGRLTLPSMMI